MNAVTIAMLAIGGLGTAYVAKKVIDAKPAAAPTPAIDPTTTAALNKLAQGYDGASSQADVAKWNAIGAIAQTGIKSGIDALKDLGSQTYDGGYYGDQSDPYGYAY